MCKPAGRQGYFTPEVKKDFKLVYLPYSAIIHTRQMINIAERQTDREIVRSRGHISDVTRRNPEGAVSSEITTVIFDLSEVYLHGFVGVEKHLLLNHQVQITNVELQTEELGKLFLGEITEDEYWNSIRQKFSWELNLQQLKKAVRDNFTEIEGTRGVIEILKNSGYSLGLLSVHAKEWIDHCEEKFDYHKFFDSISYSFEEGLSKPEQKAFELILGKLNTQPEVSLFIDDSERNLLVAEKLGIGTILFQDAVQLKEDLRMHDIKL